MGRLFESDRNMAGTDTAEALPDYGRPPVVETVLGVQFDRLTGFGNAHLGAFWKTLDQSEWPTVSDVPPLPPQFEHFTPEARWVKGLQLQFSQDPSSRLQIKSLAGDRMIQVQNNRLHFNWLGQSGGEYPRYEKVREGFAETLNRFLEFIRKEQLGRFCANQWEVTYLNHIPKGTVWSTPQDWGFFLPLRAVPTIDKLIEGESFSGEWHFVIPEKRGRLHVRWQHAFKADDQHRELVVLTLTARGPLEGVNDETQRILEGLDLGRKTIVQTFAKLMSQEANVYWGLQHVSG